MLSGLISSLGKYLSIVLGFFGSMLLAFSKGYQAGSKEAELNGLKEAQRANENAIKARRASHAATSRGGLLDDDGFKRD